MVIPSHSTGGSRKIETADPSSGKSQVVWRENFSFGTSCARARKSAVTNEENDTAILSIHVSLVRWTAE